MIMFMCWGVFCVYFVMDCVWVEFILCGKCVGFVLDEIKEMLDLCFIDSCDL